MKSQSYSIVFHPGRKAAALARQRVDLRSLHRASTGDSQRARGVTGCHGEFNVAIENGP